MSDDNRNEELEDLGKQMHDLATRGAVLGARQTIEKLEESLSTSIDLRSFLIGTTFAGAAELPDFIQERAIVEIMGQLEPHIGDDPRFTGEVIRIEGAFDDLPIFDPGNGS